MQEMEKCEGAVACLNPFHLNWKNIGVRRKQPFENRLRVSMSKINLSPTDLKTKQLV